MLMLNVEVVGTGVKEACPVSPLLPEAMEKQDRAEALAVRMSMASRRR